MARVLLLLPTATYRAADFHAAARGLGVDVVIGTERRLAISAFAEHRCVVVDLGRPDDAAATVAAFAATVPLDAVVGVDDAGVVAAAVAARRLGLPHNDPDAVRATRDKALMRRRLAHARVAQPEFGVVADGADVASAATDVGLPCVVKPVSLAASRGVIRADTLDEAAAAAARIRAILVESSHDPNEPLLVESYVPGFEVAVEGLLRSGELEILAVFDKPDPLDGPYFEETLLVTPSRLPRDALTAVARETRAATAALGLAEGPVHAELRVTGGRARVLEVAARSIGGLCSRALRFAAGSSLEDIILRHALGLPLDDLRREAAAAGVMMLPIPGSGILERVDGVDDARAVPGVGEVAITIAPGRPLTPLPEGDRYLGFILARADKPEEVEAALRAAHACLTVVLAPKPAPSAAPASQMVPEATTS